MKNPSQRIIRLLLSSFIVIILIGWLTLSPGCGSAKNKNTSSDPTTTEPTGPAPDNSAATNPSLADTSFHSDRSSPKDSGRHK